MDLSIGGIVRQVTTPVIDAVSLARTGAVEQIASFLRENPDQRGTIETTLAANGRTGDLSAIVERAGSTVSQGLDRVTASVAQVTQAAVQSAASAPPVAQAGAHVGQSAQAIVGQATPRLTGVVPEASGRPAAAAGEVLGRLGGTIAVATTGPAQAGVARPSVDGSVPTGPGRANAGAIRTGDPIGVAIRDGKLVRLLGVASKEGRLADLVGDARATGRLPALVAAARTLDGIVASLAAKGGLSATELALFARIGLLSEADAKVLGRASVPIGLDVDESVPAVLPPQDGLLDEHLDADRSTIDVAPVDGMADPALACFDAGVIRIAMRAAVETYGLLGPPGGMVVAADAFVGLLRAANGDLAQVEAELGLDAGTLGNPDTLVAFIERHDLTGLRLPDETGGPAAADWLPGGDKAGGIARALADLAPGTTFREMTFGGGTA